MYSCSHTHLALKQTNTQGGIYSTLRTDTLDRARLVCYRLDIFPCLFFFYLGQTMCVCESSLSGQRPFEEEEGGDPLIDE